MKQTIQFLQYDSLVKFLYEVHGKSNTLAIAANYTDNTSALVSMLDQVHDLSADRNLKSRINRIKKKLSNPNCVYLSGEESNISDELAEDFF